MQISSDTPIGIIGSGAMGSGIAQVAATAGHPVILYDNRPEALVQSQNKLERILHRLIEKGAHGYTPDRRDPFAYHLCG